MKEKMMQELQAVLNALNGVSVSGKENLGRLGGSISVLETILTELSSAEVAETCKRKGAGLKWR